MSDEELAEIRARVTRHRHDPPWLEDLAGVNVERLLDEIERQRVVLTRAESMITTEWGPMTWAQVCR